MIFFLFIKYRKHYIFRYRGRNCVTSINDRGFYVYIGISLLEYYRDFNFFLYNDVPSVLKTSFKW